MRAFVIAVNGQRVCTAGVGSAGVLTTIVDWVSCPGHDSNGRLGFHIGGLDSTTREHVDWMTPELEVGDVVTVEVIEVAVVDPPARRYVPESTAFG